MRRFGVARLDAAMRRVSGPLDRSAFGQGSVALPQRGRRYELTRLSLYRLGLAGTYAKYRIVPRSAIVGYEELCATVQAYRGGGELHELISGLWQRHGAPSRAAVDAFLKAAAELDRRGAEASPAELTAILAQPESLGGLDPAPLKDLDTARRRLLEAWVRACSPPGTGERLRDYAELVVCYALRRARRYAIAAAARIGSTPGHGD